MWPLRFAFAFIAEGQISTLLTIVCKHDARTLWGQVKLHQPSLHASAHIWVFARPEIWGQEVGIQEVTHIYWFLCHQVLLYLFTL